MQRQSVGMLLFLLLLGLQGFSQTMNEVKVTRERKKKHSDTEDGCLIYSNFTDLWVQT